MKTRRDTSWNPDRSGSRKHRPNDWAVGSPPLRLALEFGHPALRGRPKRFKPSLGGGGIQRIGPFAIQRLEAAWTASARRKRNIIFDLQAGQIGQSGLVMAFYPRLRNGTRAPATLTAREPRKLPLKSGRFRFQLLDV
jgi:hypothetical protein